MRTFLKFVRHYLNPLNTPVGILLFCTLLSGFIYFSFEKYLKISLSDEVFWPAALAVTGFALIKFLEVRTKRYNTLCHLEVELNQAMDALSNLISTLQKMIGYSIPILMPHDLPYLTVEYMKAVGRIDVKNNLADLLCDFRRINQDWNNLIDYGKEQADAIKNPQHPQHQEARVLGTQLLNFILKRAKTTLILIEDTLILIRIYMRSDKPFFRFGQPFVWPCELLIAIDEERKKLALDKQGRQ